MKSYSDYCLQMNRKSIPHCAAASAPRHSLYSHAGLKARPLAGQEAPRTRGTGCLERAHTGVSCSKPVVSSDFCRK